MRSVNTLYVMTELGVCESRFAKGLTVDGKPVLAVLWIAVQKNSLEGQKGMERTMAETVHCGRWRWMMATRYGRK